MPRRQYKRPPIQADPRFNSFEVIKLINHIMVDGKKTIAFDIVYKVFDKMEKEKLDPVQVLQKAIANTAPAQEVRPRRVGGASYLVPTDTRATRKLFLSYKWIVDAARSRPNKQFHTFEEKLYQELMDAYQNQGGAVEKKLQAEKLADANKAFAHFKW